LKCLDLNSFQSYENDKTKDYITNTMMIGDREEEEELDKSDRYGGLITSLEILNKYNQTKFVPTKYDDLQIKYQKDDDDYLFKIFSTYLTGNEDMFEGIRSFVSMIYLFLSKTLTEKTNILKILFNNKPFLNELYERQTAPLKGESQILSYKKNTLQMLDAEMKKKPVLHNTKVLQKALLHMYHMLSPYNPVNKSNNKKNYEKNHLMDISIIGNIFHVNFIIMKIRSTSKIDMLYQRKWNYYYTKTPNISLNIYPKNDSNNLPIINNVILLQESYKKYYNIIYMIKREISNDLIQMIDMMWPRCDDSLSNTDLLEKNNFGMVKLHRK
jgi:hypothetical protein